MSNGTRAMPKEISEVFDPLRDELIGIRELWALYRRVFGFDDDRIELLNRIADHFFAYAQWAMYLDVILALCRYTDPAESNKSKPGSRPNLTLERLVNAVKEDDASF